MKKLSKESRVMTPGEYNVTSAAELAISANKSVKNFQVQHHERGNEIQSVERQITPSNSFGTAISPWIILLRRTI